MVNVGWRGAAVSAIKIAPLIFTAIVVVNIMALAIICSAPGQWEDGCPGRQEPFAFQLLHRFARIISIGDDNAVILVAIRDICDTGSLFSLDMVLPQPEGYGTNHKHCEEPVNHRCKILSASRAVISGSDVRGTETKIGSFFGSRQGYTGSDFCLRGSDPNNILYS